MARYLTGRGVDESRIVIEDQARNTRENLELSRALLPDPDLPVAVVTNSYHVFRTALLTRDLPVMAGLTVLLFVMGWGFKGPGRINRVEGGLLVGVYLAYTTWLLTTLSPASA